MIQHTQVYDYMIRSGTIQCKWNGAEKVLPVSIGVLPRRKESECSAYCVLASENGGLRVQVFIENDTGFHVEVQSFSLETTILLPEKTQVFCNGYQSWSSSSMTDVRKGLPIPPIFKPALLQNAGDYLFSNYRHGHAHSWSYTYFTAPIGFTLLASLDETIAFTRFQFVYDKRKSGACVLVEKDCEGLFLPPVPRTSGAESPPVKILDFFMTSGDEEDCVNRYFELYYQANSIHNRVNRSHPALAWDSWYSLFTQVEENVLLSTLKEYKVREIPLDYFIIGLGYEDRIGDWMKPSANFPHGLSPVIKAVQSAGYKAGLTFCPFICSENSQIFMERPELIAKDKSGNLLRIGKIPDYGGDLYLLDLYNPQAVSYIKRCIKTVAGWGIGLLKFDFLYVAGLHSGIDFKRTRAQAISHALDLLRKFSDPLPVIACGVPIGSAVGLFEYCSVTPDLSPGWDGPNPFLTGKNIRERESTLGAITSAVGRRHLDSRAFSCDPGSFSLRRFKNRLTSREQEALFKTCIVFGGLISNSDSIGSYSADALNQYRLAIAHRATHLHDKNVLSVERTGKAFVVNYLLRSELKETTITLSLGP